MLPSVHLYPSVFPQVDERGVFALNEDEHLKLRNEIVWLLAGVAQEWRRSGADATVFP